jgi:hypothetical protein
MSKFPNYYGIFALLPLCTAAATCLPRLSPRLFQTLSLLFLAAVGLIGFPLSALLSWNTLDQRRYQPMEAWVASQLSPGEMAFIDPAAYFAARQITPNLVTQFGLPAFPDKDQISTLILWTESGLSYLQAQTIQEQLGGQWEKVESYRGADRHLRLPGLAPLARLSHASPYQLELWRKAPTSH